MTTQQTLQAEEYKQTELGELPKDWGVVKFEDCLSDKKVKVSKLQQSQFLKIGKFPIVDQSQDLIAGYWDNDEDLFSSPLPIVVFGDHTRAFKFIDFPFVCGPDGTKILIPEISKVFPKFFYYYLKLLNIPSRGYNRHYSLLKDYSIPLPPLSEQQKIAYVLSTVQTTQERTQNFIKSLKELKKSAMKHLFTYGAVSFEDIDKVELKETEIGMIPKNWETEPIKKYIIKTEQKDMRKTNIEFKYIDVSGIDREKSKIISYSNFKGKSSPSRARKIIKLNDIIIATVRPTLKRIAKIDQNYDCQICSTAFCVLRADGKKMSSNYLFYNIHRDYFIAELGRIQKGANYPAVSDSEIKNQKIQIPSLTEQQNISSILSAIDEKIQAEEQKKEALKQTFNSLLKNLMTAKIRVNDLEVGV